MPIEINGSSTPQPGRAGESGSLRVVRNEGNGERQDGGGKTPTDSVVLTGSAGLMQRLDNRIAEIPVVDTARVNTIRQSIEDGSFQPDFGRVADRLIDREIALFGNTAG